MTSVIDDPKTRFMHHQYETTVDIRVYIAKKTAKTGREEFLPKII